MPKTWNLLSGIYNEAIEASVSTFLDRKWKIADIRKNASGMHGAALFCGNGYDVYVKEGNLPFSFEQFKLEAKGLCHIRNHSPIAVPDVIDVLHFEHEQITHGIALIILEAIKVKPIETKQDWAVLGQGLATLHRSLWDKCGLEMPSYLGVFLQDNTPTSNWVEFYAKRRLWDTFAQIQKFNKNTEDDIKVIANIIEKLVVKLPDICGPEQPFSLLHGDPWLENLLFDGEKLVLIDCGIYYGNREMDLSTVALFCPVNDYFFDAYHEAYPIDPGYKGREPLWRINQYLGWVALMGAKHIDKLKNSAGYYIPL